MRDRIIVRISNAWLSQKLMQEDRLTLEKAVKEAKSSELVKEHHEILKADENGKLEGKVNGVRSKKKSHPKSRNMKDNERLKELKPHQKFPAKTCQRCGKSPLHKREECPAAKASCLKCSKQGHYAAVWKGKVFRSFEEEETTDWRSWNN